MKAILMNAAVFSLRSRAELCHRYGVPEFLRQGQTQIHCNCACEL